MLPPVVAESPREVAVAVSCVARSRCCLTWATVGQDVSVRIGWEAYFPVLSFVYGALRGVSIWTGHCALVDFGL